MSLYESIADLSKRVHELRDGVLALEIPEGAPCGHHYEINGWTGGPEESEVRREWQSATGAARKLYGEILEACIMSEQLRREAEDLYTGIRHTNRLAWEAHTKHQGRIMLPRSAEATSRRSGQ